MRSTRAIALLLALPAQMTLGGDLSDGLLAHWTFDEESGSVGEDSSPTGAHAEFAGDIAWVDGMVDGALEFGASRGSATLDQQLEFNITSYSISCWFRCEDADQFRVITSRNDGWQNRQWWLTVWQSNYSGHESGVLAFRMSPVSGTYVDLASDVRVDDNQWHHAIATVDSEAGEAKLYLDGELVDSVTGFTVPKLPAVSPSIGRDPTGSNRYFLGAIDDLRIYNRVLGADERAELSAATAQTVRVMQWREIGGDTSR